MGKHRIDKIKKIENATSRKVTFCKRKKGLIKKSIEFSTLCDVSVFLFIYDKNQQRCMHFASDPNEDFLQFFNKKYHREFFSNRDYSKVGGTLKNESQQSEEGSPSQINDAAIKDSQINEPIITQSVIDGTDHQQQNDFEDDPNE